ncbi:TPA: YjgP/YjgQ family permease [bacterium]|nr:YjgP/YjgQ family permease [bacterium]
MKLLTKYALSEIIEPFILALVAFTSVLIVDKVFLLTKYFVEKGVNPLYMLEMLFFYLPAALVLTVPMAVLVGIVTAFGRMSADNEIIAMKTSGIGMQKMIIPVVISTLILSVFMIFFMDYSIPKGNQAYTELYSQLRRKHPALVLEPNTVMEEMSVVGRKWYFSDIDGKTGRMKSITIWERSGNTPKIITAKEGELEFFPSWTALNLYNGNIYQADPKDPSKGYTTGSFIKDRIILDIAKSLQGDDRITAGPRNMSINEAKAKLKDLNEQLVSPMTQEYVKEYIRKYQLNDFRVEIYKKISIPFASLIFGLIGVPLGLIVRRGGRMVGLGVGVGLIIVYYILLTIGEKLSKAGLYPPLLGAWTPNILIGIAGIILIIKTVREAPLKTLKIINRLFPSQEQ